MRVPEIPPASDGPLTPEHHRELALANSRAKTLRKAASVARFNGWTVGVFAASSALFALSSIAGFLTTLGLSVIAYNEFRGRKRLLRFDPSLRPAWLEPAWLIGGIVVIARGRSMRPWPAQAHSRPS